MPLGFPRPVHFLLCGAVLLCGAQVPLDGCSFDRGHLACTYPAATYHIRLPDDRPPGARTPVVVVLHDAGKGAAQVLANEPLMRTFRDAGYAVVVPEALPRENRRFEYIHSGGHRPMFGRVDGTFPIEFSPKIFLLDTPAGGRRLLDFGVDQGWYFYTTDHAIYVDPYVIPIEGDQDYDFIGRDEVQALHEVLEHSAREHGTSERPALVLGFGHGGSLVWQIACFAPGFADLLAPVGGAFWGELPDRCEPGAWLLHTHERSSEFWPLSGAPGSKRRYERTSVSENIDLILRDNWCTGAPKTGRRDGARASLTTWDDCVDGGPIELLLLDRRFAFQDWWLEELLSRIGPVQTEPVLQPAKPENRKPAFKRPGSDPDSPFKRPKAPNPN